MREVISLNKILKSIERKMSHWLLFLDIPIISYNLIKDDKINRSNIV